MPGDEFRRVKPENAHLTLKFLGDIEKGRVAGLKDLLNEACSRHEQFEVEPHGIGAFPSPRKARVVWAGVSKGADALLALAEGLEQSLSTLGFEEDKRQFKPHITLARSIKQPGKLLTDGEPVTAPGFQARYVELVESSLGKGGATYTTLSEHPLSEKSLL